MNFNKFLRNKKAVSNVISTILLIALSITAVGIITGSIFTILKFRSDVFAVGELSADDNDKDGLIDFISIPLTNRGLSNADVESITLHQSNISYMWYSFEKNVKMGDIVDFDMYALGVLQQLASMETFQIEIVFQDSTFYSFGYVVIASQDILENPEYDNRDYLVLRTAEDDVYAKSDFPAAEGFSPRLWFLLGEFEDNNNKPIIDTDYISLCGNGMEEDYYPFLLDNRQFTEGNIGVQSNHQVIPYNDSGDHVGLISFNPYGNWDKNDLLNWGSAGIVYMWSYVYLEGNQPLTINVGANGASEYKVWLNGEYLFTGTGKYAWYTSTGLTLNPGSNLIMMKISAKSDAHFAGQVLFYNEEIDRNLIAQLYSIWPVTINDI
ncbi:MAG: hypothetical protein EAX90_04485 [Candidatus Heimdallarchaeota archaeon]|nr:hypothetical protein [Candidatus Heimdallarchaeota archaeon]